MSNQKEDRYTMKKAVESPKRTSLFVRSSKNAPKSCGSLSDRKANRGLFQVQQQQSFLTPTNQSTNKKCGGTPSTAGTTESDKSIPRLPSFGDLDSSDEGDNDHNRKSLEQTTFDLISDITKSPGSLTPKSRVRKLVGSSDSNSLGVSSSSGTRGNRSTCSNSIARSERRSSKGSSISRSPGSYSSSRGALHRRGGGCDKIKEREKQQLNLSYQEGSNFPTNDDTPSQEELYGDAPLQRRGMTSLQDLFPVPPGHQYPYRRSRSMGYGNDGDDINDDFEIDCNERRRAASAERVLTKNGAGRSKRHSSEHRKTCCLYTSERGIANSESRRKSADQSLSVSCSGFSRRRRSGMSNSQCRNMNSSLRGKAERRERVMDEFGNSLGHLDISIHSINGGGDSESIQSIRRTKTHDNERRKSVREAMLDGLLEKQKVTNVKSFHESFSFKGRGLRASLHGSISNFDGMGQTYQVDDIPQRSITVKNQGLAGLVAFDHPDDNIERGSNQARGVHRKPENRVVGSFSVRHAAEILVQNDDSSQSQTGREITSNDEIIGYDSDENFYSGRSENDQNRCSEEGVNEVRDNYESRATKSTPVSSSGSDKMVDGGFSTKKRATRASIKQRGKLKKKISTRDLIIENGGFDWEGKAREDKRRETLARGGFDWEGKAKEDRKREKKMWRATSLKGHNAMESSKHNRRRLPEATKRIKRCHSTVDNAIPSTTMTKRGNLRRCRSMDTDGDAALAVFSTKSSMGSSQRRSSHTKSKARSKSLMKSGNSVVPTIDASISSVKPSRSKNLRRCKSMGADKVKPRSPQQFKRSSTLDQVDLGSMSRSSKRLPRRTKSFSSRASPESKSRSSSTRRSSHQSPRKNSSRLKASTSSIKEASKTLIDNDLNEEPTELQKMFLEDPEGVVAMITARPAIAKEKDATGCLLLHFVARQKNISLSVFEKLIQAHPKACDVQCDKGYTPLHIAVEAGLATTHIKAIVKAAPRALNKQDRKGRIPLHIAANKNSNLAIFRLLVFIYPESVDIETAKGETARQIAKRRKASTDVLSTLKGSRMQ